MNVHQRERQLDLIAHDHDGMGICLCGISEEIAEELAALLSSIPKAGDASEKNGWPIKDGVALRYLDLAGMIDHGTSIKYCWRSDKGEKWLAEWRLIPSS